MDTDVLSHKKRHFDHAVLAAKNLEHRRLATERELQDLKWFAYRFITPYEATRLFYDTYRRHRVDYVREHKDRDFANTMREIPFEEFAKNPAAFASAWSARQVADTFGASYELYIRFGMWFWSRRSGGGRSKTPQINQMGCNRASEDAWRAEFKKFFGRAPLVRVTRTRRRSAASPRGV